jgi:CHASE3 domain sensor protein
VNTPVNLNRIRKDKARAEAKARAAENAVKFGRTKAEKDLAKARTDQAARLLDQHRKDPDTKP